MSKIEVLKIDLNDILVVYIDIGENMPKAKAEIYMETTKENIKNMLESLGLKNKVLILPQITNNDTHIRKVFSVDVGDMSLSDADEYIKKLACKMKGVEYKPKGKIRKFFDSILNTIGFM